MSENSSIQDTISQLTSGTSIYVPTTTGTKTLRVYLTADAGPSDGTRIIIQGYRVYKNNGRMSDDIKVYVAKITDITVIGKFICK